MFRVLHHFTTTWLLFQIITYCEGTIHWTLFPSVSPNVTNNTFPVTINSESTSDVILVKCPYTIYRHSNVGDSFTSHDSLASSKITIENEKKIFVWIPLSHNVLGHSMVTCGTINIKGIDNRLTPYNWIFKFNWQSEPKPLEIAKREKISKTLPLPSNCSNDPTKVVKFTKDEQGNMKRVNINNGELKEADELPHPNKLYYYFLVPEENSTMVHVPPCAIVRAVNEKPEIKINGQEHPVSPRNNKIYVIKRETMTEVFNIKLHLMSPDAPDFYKGEKILMKEMRYAESSITDIPNTDEMIMDSFTLNQFKILKFTYNYPTIENDNVVEKMYYFGPMKDDYTLPNQDILYLANETSIQPNCTINGITYGYFDSLTYENKNIKLNDFINNEKDNFERSGDYIILKNIKTNIIFLNCRYITPTGSVTLTQTFIKGKKVFMGKNEKGEEEYKLIPISDGSEYEKILAEQDQKIAAMKKSFFERLKDNIGAGGAYGIIIGIILIILVIITIAAIFCYIKLLRPIIIKKKIIKTYPNIFELWDQISKQDLETYSENGIKKEYISDGVQNFEYKKIEEGGEEIFTDTISLFNKNLVNCFKDINEEITAYCINNISPERKYIISDGPTKEKINYFWELLYRENVKVVVTFIDQQNNDISIDDKNFNYWPKKKEKYGNVTVQFIKNLSVDEATHLSITKFEMTVNVGKPKELTLFQVNNWNEHEIPRSDLYLTKLYEVISPYTGGSKILIHSSHQPDNRVYIFMYFSCIFEVMKKDINSTNPMIIIKNIRENFYGGSISAIEYTYIIKSLISYFMEQNMLIDLINHGLSFTEQYNNYKYKFDIYESYEDSSIKSFIKFVGLIDYGKLRYFYERFIKTQIINEKVLNKKCSRYYAVLKTERKNKIRYPEIPCFDRNSINIGEKDSTNVEGFIHANEMIYKYGEEKERKIIMCQAPLKETVDDTYDIIFKYQIEVIAVLINENELKKQNKCYPYFSLNLKDNSSKNYSLTNKGGQLDKNKCYYEYDCILTQLSTNKTKNFKLLHYINWPDKNVPSDKKSFNGFFKRLIELNKNDYLMIQCSSGVGRTGTLALIIYMIDMIKLKKSFDPIKCLDYIRQRRYKAVQTPNQFFFALSFLYEHFKNRIVSVNAEIYDKFMKLVQTLLEEEKITIN
ncbi:Protein-tyrosine phosphatase, receptor/non-receptor type domain and Protein-tyrosine/Dual specificity phosphatase domain and Protein-tyrosine phosphatase, catalytic domain-containing protein [Strongyloides ratti]|uniref:Protein-tyrosine phosphatase, receptor/non-receptor type domain and Protein-tyrosine/Dual specificity phosphatase domain and Protein-tyrosine phosphatase, catalytic domain-containing protein n=1 Tax=Strongyloides ratti TaxID=34506 RepID=A0A090LIH6_STRRB|nr:Protein-tyrosine phosphatase, receptor/non-receptor type domain and Protein-tyrosine/Dual specificity phosphatase domain and Protein-tyrosine phosphatase, catalytic domain-containing protein [Strongyloides ratti]CEF67285.1 Protein-tyrosine phosphatase, receptor/non-receptor type domain and Protein-tyrosine/Dual specificity phosphatase domain and Protein-tyrosine phosphatase, catalytic domain-containing protein [Strongyloides ratti]